MANSYYSYSTPNILLYHSSSTAFTSSAVHDIMSTLSRGIAVLMTMAVEMTNESSEVFNGYTGDGYLD